MVARGKLDPANFKPGPQQPNKYPQTGANYAQWGEVRGMQYDPWTDSYFRDKKAYEDFLVSSGQVEKPKDPSLLDTVAPVAALGGALALSEGLGTKAAGLFGLGGEAAATTAAGTGAATTGAATGAGTAAASNLAGLQGLGATAPAAAGSAGAGTAAAGAGAEAAGAGAGVGLGQAALAGGSLLAGGLGIRDLYTHDRGDARSILQGAGSGAVAGAGIGSAFGGIGAVPGALVGGGIGLLAGIGSRFAQHESTRDATAKKTNELLEASSDPTYQNYVTGMREQYKEAPKGPAYAGMFNTFDEYKKAGLQANDLTGVYGNIKVFGPEWANLSEDQRQQVTQGIINAGLYDSKKGDVIITDEEKARAIKDSVLGKGAAPQQPQANAIPRPIANAEKKALESWK